MAHGTEMTFDPNQVKLGQSLQFYPPEKWGLDYYFRVFQRMYICDVLDMPEYPMFPGGICHHVIMSLGTGSTFWTHTFYQKLFAGAFAYKNHPIYRVDVLGIIVKVEEKSKCFIYAVDDGTGVIPCCCWKNTFQSGDSVGENQFDTLPELLKQRASLLVSSVENLSTGYSLGDLVNVRGKVKIFRENKEIVATFHRKIEDPMFEVLRMTELPNLYVSCYDKPFELPYKVTQELAMHKEEAETGQCSERRLAFELKSILIEHFQKNGVVEISAPDLLILSKVKNILDKSPTGTKSSTSRADPIDGLGIVLQALHLLEVDGQICQRGDRRMLYEVLLHKSKLETAILKLLNTEVHKSKYEEKGCHYLHIVDELQKTLQYPRVQKSAVLFVLQKLEAHSDVIRTTQYHYLPCNV